MQTNSESAAVEAVAWLDDEGVPWLNQQLAARFSAFAPRPLVHQSALDALRGEVERLRKSNELYSFAMNTAGIDELKRRADAAERRLAEVREIQRSNYGNGVGLHLEMILWAREYDALTKESP